MAALCVQREAYPGHLRIELTALPRAERLFILAHHDLRPVSVGQRPCPDLKFVPPQ